MTPRHFYGDQPELELIELGTRAAYCYDEPFALAYRIGAALGIPRRNVPVEWQRAFMSMKPVRVIDRLEQWDEIERLRDEGIE